MNDRANVHRPASYSYPPFPSNSAPPRSYSTTHHTSSAFSASANPNEDWTKISDLAERRRIQNRIAQRNYRKKLKKRLEDLERRAGSSSASPEQKHEELPASEPASSTQPSTRGRQRNSSDLGQPRRDRTPDILPQQYVLPSEDRGMFSQQFTRQLSTSPPPFSYGGLSTIDNPSYVDVTQSPSFCSIAGSAMDMALYPSYFAGMQQHYQPTVSSMTSPLIKEEYYHDDDMNPFSMSYATIAGVDVSAAQSYQGVAAYTPPLSDSFDYSQSDSPPDSAAFPQTPISMPRTPPLQSYDLLYYD